MADNTYRNANTPSTSDWPPGALPKRPVELTSEQLQPKYHEEIDRVDSPDADEANRDAITGAPGSHPVGTGIGAAAAGALGAEIGTLLGPAGTLIGGAIGVVVGAIAGGLAGKAVAEGINPSDEDQYWSQHYLSRPYVASGSSYDEYRPAYQYGYHSRSVIHDRSFDDVQSEMETHWDKVRGKSTLEWNRARDAARDAWDRADTNLRAHGRGRDVSTRGTLTSTGGAVGGSIPPTSVKSMPGSVASLGSGNLNNASSNAVGSPDRELRKDLNPDVP
jgi:hypothetical protein